MLKNDFVSLNKIYFNLFQYRELKIRKHKTTSDHKSQNCAVLKIYIKDRKINLPDLTSNSFYKTITLASLFYFQIFLTV